MTDVEIVAVGLRFPEGPVAMADGSVLVVEIARGTLSRIRPGGAVEIVARCGGGPNGAALGPDGKVYVCNNGSQPFVESDGRLMIAAVTQDERYEGGSIQRVDLASGTIETLYTECDRRPLRSPNDLVFDADGGFWFTDTGKARARDRDWGGVYYARPDGSEIREVIYPLDFPNGVALSPAGDRLYVAETTTARLWWWRIEGPGRVDPRRGLLFGLGGGAFLDSLAVDAAGNVCAGTLFHGGITVVSPAGEAEHIPIPDPLVSNICFGGDDLRTAYITLSATGRLARLPWPRPGLRPAWSG